MANMHSEMAKMPVSRLPTKKKTGSIESIRDLDAVLPDPSTSTPAQQSRKRKPASLLSRQASGPSKYRSRTMILVYYDGEIQKQFEALVRSIGMGRNLLRKGKMAARMEALAELAGSDDNSDGDEADPAMAKIGYRHRTGLSSLRTRSAMSRGPTTAPGNNAPPSPELFDTIDKSLELAQGLCEKAAHQSLRDGDCRKEVDAMKVHFQDVLVTAGKEVTRYQARKKMEAEKEAQNKAVERDANVAVEEEPKVSAEESLKIEIHTDAPAPKHTPAKEEPKAMMPIVQSAPAMIPVISKAMDIEIDDDDDDDDMSFVMPPIRLTSRA